MDKVYRVTMTVDAVVSARNEDEARDQAIIYGALNDAENFKFHRVLTQDDLPGFYSIDSQPCNGIGFSIQDHIDQKA